MASSTNGKGSIITKAINRAGQEKRITTHPNREARYKRAVERNLSNAERIARASYAAFMLRFKYTKPSELLARVGARKVDCSVVSEWYTRAYALINC